MKVKEWMSGLTFIIIVGILGAIIVALAFFHDKIILVGNNTEGGIYTAISIMVAMFAALFIWTAVKENEFKGYKSELDKLTNLIESLKSERTEDIEKLKKKELEELNKLATLNYTLFHVSREGNDKKDDFIKFREQLFKAVKLGRISKEEVLRISRIIWQQDKLIEAFLIRKESYQKDKCLYNAVNYCSISNYVREKDSDDLICSENNVNKLIDILTKHVDEGFDIEGCSENRIWAIAGQRFIRNANNRNNNLQIGLFCFLKALKLSPGERYYHRNFILGAITLKDITVSEIDLETIAKLDNLKIPTTSISETELKQYIINELLIFSEFKLESEYLKNQNYNELLYSYFTKWKDELIPKITPSSSNHLLYNSFILLIEDIFKVIKNGRKFYLFDFFNVEIIAKRAAMKDVDKASIFNTYQLLKNKYGESSYWEKIELLYLTFYNFMAADDYEADKILTMPMKTKIYNKVVPLWCNHKCIVKKEKSTKT